MKEIGLRCVSCHQPALGKDSYLCDACNGILDVVYTGSDQGSLPLSQTFENMPLTREEMGRIGLTPTPLLRSRLMAEKLGLHNLYFKCEMANLTGSFKDRPVAVAVAMAKKLGYRQVVTASSGNAAAATAACAARQGLGCIVIVPAATPDEKVKQTVFYGAKVFKVEGPYSNSYKMAFELAEKHSVYNVTTTYLNPYALEGDKLVGYELYETLGRMPDRVYVPVGAGPLLGGIYKGLMEYAQRDGLAGKPRMVAMQPEGNNPIAVAFDKGEEHVLANLHPNTIAGGIADGLVGYEQDGEYTLRLCRESGGAARSVSDEEIRAAQALLAEKEGLFVEPSAAASAAGVLLDIRQGRLAADDLIVVVLTGHGLKDMKALPTQRPAPVVHSTSDIADALY